MALRSLRFRSICFLALSLLSVSLLPSGLRAADAPLVTADETPVYVAKVNFDEFRKTNIGKKLMLLVEAMAKEELGGEGDAVQKITEGLGFNPMEELQSVTVMADSRDLPDESLRVVISLGKTTGNLEGLVLTLPGYDSEEIGEHTIHSADLDGQPAFAAIRESRGNKQVVAAMSRSNLMDLLDGKGGKVPALPNGEPTLLQIHASELPPQLKEEFGDNHPLNTAIKLISSFMVVVTADDDSFGVTLRINATSEKKADQIKQLAQGARALLSLMEDDLKQDKDFMAVKSILDEVKFGHEGKTFSASVDVPEQFIMKFLQEEAGLPL